MTDAERFELTANALFAELTKAAPSTLRGDGLTADQRFAKRHEARLHAEGMALVDSNSARRLDEDHVPDPLWVEIGIAD